MFYTSSFVQLRFITAPGQLANGDNLGTLFFIFFFKTVIVCWVLIRIREHDSNESLQHTVL